MSNMVGKVKVDLNIGPEQADNCHGHADDKDIIVLHETVSPDYKGLADIRGVSQYLDAKDYGIHGIIDLEANFAWAMNEDKCIFYHTMSGNGMINTRGMGIELISNVMTRSPKNSVRRAIWVARKAQLRETAKVCAALCRKHDIPIQYSEGHVKGITTHWQITTTFHISGGHTDCWPVHKGGYFPVMNIIYLARQYKRLGY